MANDLIRLDRTVTTAIFANDLRDAVLALRKARSDLEKIKGWMVHSYSGSDYSALEERFGIDTGLGDDAFLLVDGACQAMDGTSSGYIKDLLDRIG